MCLEIIQLKTKRKHTKAFGTMVELQWNVYGSAIVPLIHIRKSALFVRLQVNRLSIYTWDHSAHLLSAPIPRFYEHGNCYQ